MADSQRTITLGGGGGIGVQGPRSLRDAARQYAMLPLRVFLGVTFIYAGLDKLTDDAFLDASGPGSLSDTLTSVEPTVGAPFLIDIAQKSPETFGWLILLGEIVVGLGILFGLFGRLAAVGGALISLTFWLTMSWAVEPYYLGNDLIYLMAWIPFILAGTPYLSLDALLAKRRRRQRF